MGLADVAIAGAMAFLTGNRSDNVHDEMVVNCRLDDTLRTRGDDAGAERRSHDYSPSTRRSSATGHARRPWTRTGRIGPFSKQAHNRNV
jgi:hypothetical protein